MSWHRIGDTRVWAEDGSQRAAMLTRLGHRPEPEQEVTGGAEGQPEPEPEQEQEQRDNPGWLPPPLGAFGATAPYASGPGREGDLEHGGSR